MSAPIRVLELRSVRGTGGGPEKTILLGSARTDPRRFAITVCYIRDARDQIYSIDARASGLPVDYVELIEKHSLDPSIWPKLRRIVRERRIDIVHAHEYKTDLLAWMLAKAEGITPLATVHGWTGHSWRERRFYYPLDKRLLARFPKLIAVSSDLGKELIAHGASPDKVVTVSNGIDHTAFNRDRSRETAVRQALALSPGDLVIGAVGRLEPQKRFDLLIDAFKTTLVRHPKAKLLVVGGGSLVTELSDQITRLGLSGACRLIGHRSDIADLHHAFDLFVQSSDYEGTSNAVLEAMALETPVVATDVGGTVEIIRDRIDGLIVPPGSAEVLAVAIDTALTDRETTRVRAASARRRVETDLSFATRMSKVEAIYTALLERENRTGNGRMSAELAGSGVGNPTHV